MSASPGDTPGDPTPVTGRRVPALLVMHGELAQALLNAARKVYDDVSGVRVLSNDGLDKTQIGEKVAVEVADWHDGGLVLTDFWGGSCHLCAMSAVRGNPRILLLTGVNLPMLLDYLHNRDRFEVEVLAERMLQRGRENIRTQRGPGSTPTP
jgi:mannose/fructose-specific phosphotransferase system component IIA